MDEKSKTIRNILLASVLVIVCLFSFFVSLDVYDENDNASNSANDILAKAEEDSSKIKEEETKEFIEISMDQYLEFYNGSNQSIVLISRPSCSYCQIAEPILKNISYEYNVDINCLNTDDFSSEDKVKLAESDEYFEEGLNTPLLLIVSNGKIIDKVAGLVDKASYIDFFEAHEVIK